MIKPDGVARNLVGEIIGRFEVTGTLVQQSNSTDGSVD